MITLIVIYIIMALPMGVGASMMISELIPGLDGRILVVFCLVWWPLAWALMIAFLVLFGIYAYILYCLSELQGIWS